MTSLLDKFVDLVTGVSTRWLDSLGVILLSIAANLLFSPQWPVLLNLFVVGCLGSAGVVISHVAQESRDLIDDIREEKRSLLETQGRKKLRREELETELITYLKHPERRKLPYMMCYALFALIAIPVALGSFYGFNK